MDKCMWVGAGYPVLLTAIAVLWKAWEKSRKENKAQQLLVLEEKDRHIRELEAFKKIVEDRQKGKP